MSDELQLLQLRQRQARARAAQQQAPAVKPPVEPQGNLFRDLIRAGAQGLSFGTGDEIEAFVRSRVGDQTYAENLGTIRSEIKNFADENPGIALGAEIAGSIPTALAGGAGLARLGVKGALKVGGIEGAAYGFGAGEGGAAERAKNAAVSGALSAGIGKTADAVFPRVGEAASQLLKEGVRLTPGQRVGGMTRALEERATSIPFVGDIIEATEQNALSDFNRAAMNTSMRILGKGARKIPKKLQGQEAYQFAKDQLDEAYARVIPKLKADVGSEFEDGLVRIIQDNADLGEDGLKTFQAKLQKILASKVTADDRILRGDVLKTVDSDLGFEATKFLKSSVASERDLGSALSEVQTLLRQSMEGISPQANREYKKVRTAFRTLLPVRKAVVAATTRQGNFTPAQLLRGSKAADQSRDKILTATGKAPQQQLGSAAQEVIGRTIPDSGTAERAMLGVMLNQLRNQPGATLGGGALATGLTGLAYSNPLGRSITSGLLQTPRIAGVGGAPAIGATAAGPTIEQLRLLEERLR